MSISARVSYLITSTREMVNFPFLFFLFILNLRFCLCIEIFSGAATALGVGLGAAAYNYLKCSNYECCNDDWIHFDESRLAKSFENKLFGQHLADMTISKSLRGFFKNSNPKKALVISFNGLTGSGKNYAANMIANSTYKLGTGSSFVHIYSGLKDFPHKQKVSLYQDRLRSDIVQFTKACQRSLFIFDECDKMPPGTLDALKPYIDYYEQVDGVDYRKNIFIFLSNAGSSSIVGLTLEFWAQGRQREEITMKDIEPLINRGAFNENGGFQFSELLRSELIDIFVPFLPLERKHVENCIAEELKSRNAKLIIDHKLIQRIANDLVYFPPENELYSKSGCKRIVQKIDLYFE